MTRSEPNAFIATEELTRVGAQEERPSCLACGVRIHSVEPTIKIGNALLHIRCAVYRRRMARR
jgi:hypothetical protein